MGYKVYKVIQTTDLGVMERTFLWMKPDTIARPNGSFSLWLGMDAAGIEAGGDSLTGMYWLSSSVSYSLAISLGVKAMNVADFYVGERFYFGDNSYIRISAKTTSGSGVSLAYSITYQFYKNNTLVGTYAGASIWSDESVLLFPFKFTGKYNGTTTQNCDRYGIRQYTQSGTDYLSGYEGPGSTGTLDWLKTYYDDFTPVDVDDPYMDIDDSEPSGPASGDGIPDTDAIDIPGLPTVSVVDTGFVTLFNPSLTQVKNLANYMWAGLFDINTFKKIFADPMDCILGFNMLPVSIPNGGSGEVVVGNISTGVSMTKASSQWVEVDCGTLAVPEPYGSYLDWAPYVKVSLMLPYIGIVDLSTDDVMGRTLTLKYHVDVLSCSCVAFLKCGPDTLYQFTGSCGYSIPVTGDNFRQMIANVVSIAATIGGAVASGGITAPAAVAAGASVAQNVMNSKPEIHRSGAIGASAGIMGVQKPYLIMDIPKACKPKKQYHYLGYPSFVTVQLNDISGYAEFDNIILDGVACTEAERQLILNLCKGGVYL